MNWVKGLEIDLDAVTKCVHRKKTCFDPVKSVSFGEPMPLACGCLR